MSILDAWNKLPEQEALRPILACCGSRAFAAAVVGARPFADSDALSTATDRIWWSLAESDWLEAFACHPKIGESSAPASSQFSAWSHQEQAQVRSAEAATLETMAQKNHAYQQRHGFIYIVCASGKTGDELLAILDRRLANPTSVELKEAAEQQRQITQLRLRKWLNQ
jgi:OHCU decarboxylase